MVARVVEVAVLVVVIVHLILVVPTVVIVPQVVVIVVVVFMVAGVLTLRRLAGVTGVVLVVKGGGVHRKPLVWYKPLV